MSQKLNFKLRRDREAEGQEPLFDFTALSDFADRWLQRYKESAHYKKSKKSFPRTLYLYIVFCIENDLRNEAAKGIQELILYYERIYGFLPPAEAGIWQLRLAKKKQESIGSSILREPEEDFLKGLGILQNNDAEHTRDYLMGMRDLAEFYFDQKEYDLGDKLLRDAFDTALRTGNKDVELLVRFQANVGLIHYRAKEHEEAVFHFGWALRRMRVCGLESKELEYRMRKQYAWSLAQSGRLVRASIQYGRVTHIVNELREHGVIDATDAQYYENLSAYCLAIHAYNLSQKDNDETALSLFEKALCKYETLETPNEDYVRECSEDYVILLKRLGREEYAKEVEDRTLDLITRNLGFNEE